jgi:hypothetical protein
LASCKVRNPTVQFDSTIWQHQPRAAAYLAVEAVNIKVDDDALMVWHHLLLMWKQMWNHSLLLLLSQRWLLLRMVS